MATYYHLPMHERPLARPGLTSYRYRGRYGWTMIGARSESEALSEAARSVTGCRSVGELDTARLEVWDGSRYVPARPHPSPAL